MRSLLRALLSCLAWAALAAPGQGQSAGPDGIASCVREFTAHPENPEAARCFWQSVKEGSDHHEAAKQVRQLLAHYPENPGLLMCSAVLNPLPADRAEWLLRSAAGGYSHRNVEGEVLARDNLVLHLLAQGRVDEARGEVAREQVAASRCGSRGRDRCLALATISGAWLLVTSGDLEQAGVLLDRVPPGPLRETRWLQMAGNIHVYTGRLDQAWDDCARLLSQPALSHSQRAVGLYCQAQALMVRAVELPLEANATSLEEVARAARREAEAGGNGTMASLASWLLILLAKGEDAARADFRRCISSAGRESDSRICRSALVRWQVSAARGATGGSRGEAPDLYLESSISRAESSADRMHVAWKVHRTFDDFITEGQQALSDIERLRAQQRAPDLQMSLFSAWSGDYYWFSGRLFDAALGGRCDSCLDRGFGVIERLRARALHDLLVAVGAELTSPEVEAERLAAIRQAIERVDQRRRDSSLPPSERLNAESDLRLLTADEAHLRREAKAAGAAGVTVSPTGSRVPRAPDFISLFDVQRLLAPEEALLSFQIAPWRDWTGDFGGGSWLVVATRGDRRCYRLDEMGREDLRRAVADLFQQRSRSQAWQAVELYRRLLAPALAELPARIDRLIIVPDDHLHRLPFAALRAKPGDRPLAWRYQLEIVPSATLWARWRAATRPRPAARPALVLADPPPPSETARKTFQAADGITLPGEPLPASRREADALVRFLGWGCERRVGGEVSESAFFGSRLSPRRFALLHFAAHSIVDERDPRRSGIWLSPSPGHDGLLRAAEIAQLRFDDRLVVLSSCSSNGGPFLRGEGVLSLAHAFFQARARTVVASLWPQLDTDAEALFTAFYRHLGQGASVAAALRLAQLDRLRQDPNLPPVAWAGMVVLGDGDLVPFPGGRHPWPPRWLLAAAAAAAALLAALMFCVFRARRSRSSPGKGRAILGSAR
jgi:CHAT domain-containing protein